MYFTMRREVTIKEDANAHIARASFGAGSVNAGALAGASSACIIATMGEGVRLLSVRFRGSTYCRSSSAKATKCLWWDADGPGGGVLLGEAKVGVGG